MDSNKDDALKCLSIGKEALGSGDAMRARKFLNKAKRLNPSLSVDELLAACDDLPKETQTEEFSACGNPSSKEPVENVQNPRNSGGRSSAQPNAAGSSSYAAEQMEIVRNIRRNKDYYAILGLEKSCSVEDVRKAYRKLSLKVHPDKNKAPGSEEAFKALSKAFQCLSNKEMRRKYDLTGSDEDFETSEQRPTQFRRRRPRQGIDEEDFFDADEIFRSFFFGAPQSQFFHQAEFMRARAAGANNRTQEGATNGFNLFAVLQLLPIVLLFLLSYFPFNEPHYSLQKAYPYQFRKVTEDFSVPYYVRSVDFDKEYKPGSSQRVDLEKHVIRDYTNILSRYCQMEAYRRQFNKNIETPHCDELRQFQNVR
eukprot:TRINITY_DN1609_c0_g1_i1.p1 TRINITY_DN1609_c0_g1~~TRINITY_DN1609_c0_g1_i1.p1  ORF type:complete len:367 (+),score=49.86 TRINITY_DN1609_c0_g1_i1:346-1446(+)